jgi:SSS family solute:Na+ symporter
MSGMAGNVSAFSTVWTYDLYGAYIKKDAADSHYVAMGRWSTIVGMLVSVGTAYLVAHAASIMDYVQALFSFFIAPLFGTVVLGMLWKRATQAGGFWGLLAGTIASISMWIWVQRDGTALRYIARCQTHGGEPLSRAMEFFDLRHRDLRCEHDDRACAGETTRRSGLWRHGATG